MSAIEGPSRGPQLLAAVWCLVALSGIFLGLRVFCKFRVARGLWWDDYALIAAWMCLFVPAICLIQAVALGFGHRIAALDPAAVPTLMQWVIIGGSPTLIAIELSKSAFALTLMKIFESKRMKWFLAFIITTICLFVTVNFVIMYLRCTPVKKIWDITVEGTCWDNDAITSYSMFAAGYSAAMDFVLALLPWKLVWGLQMKLHEKLGVAIAMSMGVFAGTASAIKTYYLSQLLVLDFSYDAYDLQVWGYAESAVTIIAASIPILRVLVRQSSKAYRSHTTGTFKLSTVGHSTAHCETNRRASRTNNPREFFTVGPASGDNLSSKGILRESDKNGVILQTTEVNIQYSNRSDKANDSGSEIAIVV